MQSGGSFRETSSHNQLYHMSHGITSRSPILPCVFLSPVKLSLFCFLPMYTLCLSSDGPTSLSTGKKKLLWYRSSHLLTIKSMLLPAGTLPSVYDRRKIHSLWIAVSPPIFKRVNHFLPHRFLPPVSQIPPHWFFPIHTYLKISPTWKYEQHNGHTTQTHFSLAPWSALCYSSTSLLPQIPWKMLSIVVTDYWPLVKSKTFLIIPNGSQQHGTVLSCFPRTPCAWAFPLQAALTMTTDHISSLCGPPQISSVLKTWSEPVLVSLKDLCHFGGFKYHSHPENC